MLRNLTLIYPFDVLRRRKWRRKRRERRAEDADVWTLLDDSNAINTINEIETVCLIKIVMRSRDEDPVFASYLLNFCSVDSS